MTQVNNKVKIKKIGILGKVVEIKFYRGIKRVVVELDNGVKWEGPESKLVVLP